MKKGLMICCLLLWGGFIFYQGSRSVTVSQGISDHFVNRAVILVQKCLPSMNAATIYQILNVAIRKLAHFTEYALLGGGSSVILSVMVNLKGINGFTRCLLSYYLPLLMSISNSLWDELHRCEMS